MKNKLVIIFTLILLFTTSLTFANSNTSATVIEMKGEVNAKKANKTMKAFEKMKLTQNDSISTGANSFVKLLLDKKVAIALGEKTNITIGELKKSDGSYVSKIDIKYGTVLNTIEQKLDKDNKYIIQTPTMIMGARGTRWLVTVNSKFTKISVLESSVNLEVKGRADLGSRILKAGESLIIKNDSIDVDFKAESKSIEQGKKGSGIVVVQDTSGAIKGTLFEPSIAKNGGLKIPSFADKSNFTFISADERVNEHHDLNGYREGASNKWKQSGNKLEAIGMIQSVILESFHNFDVPASNVGSHYTSSIKSDIDPNYVISMSEQDDDDDDDDDDEKEDEIHQTFNQTGFNDNILTKP